MDLALPTLRVLWYDFKMPTYPHLGSFPGDIIPPSEVATTLTREVKGALAQLYVGGQTCWFGYRFLIPEHRVYLFLDRFAETAKSFHRKYMGKSLYIPYGSFYSDPLKAINTRSIRAVFKAVCYADHFGIPYDFWCASIFQYTKERKWKRAPSLLQMYIEKAVPYVIQQWKVYVDNFLVITEDENYIFDRHCCHQEDYWGHLIKCINGKEQRHYAVATLLYQKQQIDASWVIRFYGAELLRLAEKAALV